MAKSSKAIGTYSHHMPSKGGSAGRPAGSASPIGRMPHDRSRLPSQVLGSTTISSPSTTRWPLQVPSWANRCAFSVHTVAGPQDVRLFLDDVEQALPGEIGCNAFGFVENYPKLVQRFDDLEAVAVDVLVEPVLIDGVRNVHRGLGIPAPDEHERVLHPRLG